MEVSSNKLLFHLFFLVFSLPSQPMLKIHHKTMWMHTARSQMDVPNITWDDTVAKFVQNYTNQHKAESQTIVFSNSSSGKILKAISTGYLSGIGAVKLWVAQKTNYNYKNNSCIDGGYKCFAYTQVVWKNSTHLGSAKAMCNDGGTLIGCRYDPVGNIKGERPY